MTERKQSQANPDEKDNTWESEGGQTKRAHPDGDDEDTTQPAEGPDQPGNSDEPHQPQQFPAKKK